MDDPRYLRLSRALLVLHGVTIMRQARALRAEVLHLPDAAPPWRGSLDGPDPIRLLVFGDSTAAGTGVATQDEGLPGHLSQAIRRHTGRGTTWRAVGENGATARDLLERYLEEAVAEPADLVFLTVGSNDSIHARTPGAFRRDLRSVLTALSVAMPDAIVLVSSFPVFGLFPFFPEPTRTTLFRHARNLERVAREEVARDPRWMISGNDAPPYGDDFFAVDNFHPSSSGYREWADWAIDEAWGRGLERIAR